MSLVLHYHPLSSCSWKVLLALDEMGIAFTPEVVQLGDATPAEFLALWPTGKIPLLVDGDRVVPETSIIIEYLGQGHAAPGRALLPDDPGSALETRLLDRMLDLYVMTPMQAIVADRLRAESERDPLGVAKARETLSMAYGLLDARLAGRTWMAGESFTLADCAAAPALFYATTVVPLPAACARLGDYVERVLQRPSMQRVLEAAQPFFAYYPYREALPVRYQGA